MWCGMLDVGCVVTSTGGMWIERSDVVSGMAYVEACGGVLGSGVR